MGMEFGEYYGMDGQKLTYSEWVSLWSDNNSRRVGLNYVGPDGEVMVSTVLLGLDHNWSDEGPPIIFETMIFGGDHDQEQWRYATREEALAGHDAAVALARGQDVSSR